MKTRSLQSMKSNLQLLAIFLPINRKIYTHTLKLIFFSWPPFLRRYKKKNTTKKKIVLYTSIYGDIYKFCNKKSRKSNTAHYSCVLFFVKFTDCVICLWYIHIYISQLLGIRHDLLNVNVCTWKFWGCGEGREFPW